MERKIGEIFEYNGEWYQCIVGCYCPDCAFCNNNCEERERITLGNKLTKEETTGFCTPEFREDGKSVIFKKLKKVGGFIITKGRIFQKLTSDNNSCKECVFNVPNKACCKNSYIEGICDDNGFWIEIKQNKEDMEEGNNTKYSNSENIGKNLKPFDLQAAKSGKPVCTRDGRKARIICFDRENEQPIVALIKGDEEEYIDTFFNNGHSVSKTNEVAGDLMMLPEKKEGWVNVSKFSTYASKEEALSHKTYDIIDTIKVSWEE